MKDAGAACNLNAKRKHRVQVRRGAMYGRYYYDVRYTFNVHNPKDNKGFLLISCVKTLPDTLTI